MDGPSLAAVRTEDECVKAPLPEMEQTQRLGGPHKCLVSNSLILLKYLRRNTSPAQVIQHSHVCIHVVEVVRIRRVFFLCPVPWQRAVQVKDMLLWF